MKAEVGLTPESGLLLRVCEGGSPSYTLCKIWMLRKLDSVDGARGVAGELVIVATALWEPQKVLGVVGLHAAFFKMRNWLWRGSSRGDRLAEKSMG